MELKSLTVESMWEVYKNTYVPKSAGPQQIDDMRKCFFAGFISLFELLKMVGDSSSPEHEVLFVCLLSRFNNELDIFNNAMIERALAYQKEMAKKEPHQ